MKADSQLQQDGIAELKREPSVRAGQVGMEVKDGVVTLACIRSGAPPAVRKVVDHMTPSS